MVSYTIGGVVASYNKGGVVVSYNKGGVVSFNSESGFSTLHGVLTFLGVGGSNCRAVFEDGPD